MELDPLEFLAAFLPRKRRRLTRTGVQIHDLQYWAEALEPWIGQGLNVPVHYDSRDITRVYVRTPGGVLVMATLTTPGVPAISLVEWQVRRTQERAVSRDPDVVASADASQKRADELVSQAKASRKARRRKATAAAGDRFRVGANADRATETENHTPPKESELEPIMLDTPLLIYDIEGYDHDD
jgi:putative transposase